MCVRQKTNSKETSTKHKKVPRRLTKVAALERGKKDGGTSVQHNQKVKGERVLWLFVHSIRLAGTDTNIFQSLEEWNK